MNQTVDLTLGPERVLDQILADPQLPSPPALALQVVEQVSHPECDLGAVSRLLSQDAALCSKLLKTVNSAYYSTGKPVTSIKRAITVVGFSRLRLMILGLSLPAVQFRVAPDGGMRRYWKGSVAGALIARELAGHLRLPTADEDLIAGLLRDLGMVLLRQVLDDAYWPVWSGRYGVWGSRQTDWERQILGFDHADLGARLLGKWGLPGDLVGLIRYHHDPAGLPTGAPALARRARLLDLASRLALLAEDDQPAEVIQELLQIAQTEFGLDFAALEQLLAAVQPKIDAFAGVLQVDIGSSPGFAAVLDAGRRELARLSASVPGPALKRAAAPPPAQPGPAAERPPGPTVIDLAAPDFQWGLEGEFSLHFTALLGRSDVVVRVRDYHLEKELGRGAMGVVFQGWDRAARRPVAIKMMLPDLARSPVALKRFAREARLAAAIRHPNVVTTYAVHELCGTPFLVMELVPGRSLQDWLEAGRSFAPPEIARIGHQVAQGLAAAHALRLVHRDVKPANVLLADGSDRAQLSDFGLARSVNDTAQLTAAGDVVGTPQYMSPEQVESGAVGPSSDLFSLGSLLYVLCTGRSPFTGPTVMALMTAIQTRRPVPVREVNPAAPDWLADLIGVLHTKDPAARPAAAAVAAFLAHQLDPCAAALADAR